MDELNLVFCFRQLNMQVTQLMVPWNQKLPMLVSVLALEKMEPSEVVWLIDLLDEAKDRSKMFLLNVYEILWPMFKWVMISLNHNQVRVKSGLTRSSIKLQMLLVTVLQSKLPELYKFFLVENCNNYFCRVRNEWGGIEFYESRFFSSGAWKPHDIQIIETTWEENVYE